ncbi:GntR family transcriptional regulator [Actinomadura macrotermitis]|uniref:Transcriptional regulator NanR n=1 Tax=Actinomadura macrotermitis TaxID=2585200 RepID=A0A7K0C5E7_9ACTN|nr:Transcriptional regulator NanR [Actinomadura macrotermitis]
MSRPTAWGAYIRIAATLCQRIEDSTYGPGARLPAEVPLSAEFKVARNTVRRALAMLEAEGLVMAQVGVGWFVHDPEASTVAACPQYERIAADLRAKIESGEFSPGDALPSEARICERYSVARFTARQAFASLESSGLIECIHGRGRFVRSRRP